MGKIGKIIFCLALLGCGGSSEASPIKKGQTVDVKLAIVGESIGWCDASVAWSKLIHPELLRVTRRKTYFNLEYDQMHQTTRPELLTVDGFWNGSLGEYWKGLIPPDKKYIRMVSLPPLMQDGRPLYGGMTYGRGLGAWFFINGERGNATRIALITLHELGHVLGSCHHNCPEGRAFPNLMCPEDAPVLKLHPELLVYDSMCTSQIRRKLDIKGGGKTLVIK